MSGSGASRVGALVQCLRAWDGAHGGTGNRTRARLAFEAEAEHVAKDLDALERIRGVQWATRKWALSADLNPGHPVLEFLRVVSGEPRDFPDCPECAYEQEHAKVGPYDRHTCEDWT